MMIHVMVVKTSSGGELLMGALPSQQEGHSFLAGS
jgi:hypothetical protein